MTHVQAREHLEPLASTEKLVERRGLYFPLRASKGNQHFQRLAFGELWENECLFYVIQFVINYYSSSSIPGSGRSFGEGIGYPLQYSWASLVVQLVKNLPAMQEESACSAGKLGSIPGLGRSLEKGKATHSIFWLEISMDCILHGVPKVRHDWATFTSLLHKNASVYTDNRRGESHIVNNLFLGCGLISNWCFLLYSFLNVLLLIIKIIFN